MFAMFPRNPRRQRRALKVGLGRSCRGAVRWLGPGLLVLAQGLGMGLAQAQFSTRIVGSGPRSELPEERAVSTVTQSEIEQRLVRSAPDALRYEAGVFIQQSAHGQASAFLRGLTGQQTLLSV
jgi:outer membrane receptor for ferrienterochelin and colicin